MDWKVKAKAPFIQPNNPKVFWIIKKVQGCIVLLNLYYKSKIELMLQDVFIMIKLHVIGCLHKLKLETFPNKSATMFSYYIPWEEYHKLNTHSKPKQIIRWLLHTSGSFFAGIIEIAVCHLSSGARAIPTCCGCKYGFVLVGRKMSWLGLAQQRKPGNNVTAAYKRDSCLALLRMIPSLGWQWERLAI